MINLSEDQKNKILEIFENNPNILNITKIIFEDDSLDGRSKEGRAVTKFLAENGLKAKTTKREKIKEISLSQEQLEKIEELKQDKLNTSEIADIIFQTKVTRLSKEWRSLNEIINQSKEEEKDKGEDSAGNYIAPQAVSRIIKKLTTQLDTV